MGVAPNHPSHGFGDWETTFLIFCAAELEGPPAFSLAPVVAPCRVAAASLAVECSATCLQVALRSSVRKALFRERAPMDTPLQTAAAILVAARPKSMFFVQELLIKCVDYEMIEVRDWLKVSWLWVRAIWMIRQCGVMIEYGHVVLCWGGVAISFDKFQIVVIPYIYIYIFVAS